MQKIEIVYNDDWDKAHYPIEEKHQTFLEEVYSIFSIDRSVASRYFVTSHGVIFHIPMPKQPRFYRETLESLMKLTEFRWISFEDESQCLQVAMKH